MKTKFQFGNLLEKIKNLKLYSLEQIEQNFYKQERKFKIYQNEHNRIKQPYNHNIKQIFKISYFV